MAEIALGKRVSETENEVVYALVPGILPSIIEFKDREGVYYKTNMTHDTVTYSCMPVEVWE